MALDDFFRGLSQANPLTPVVQGLEKQQQNKLELAMLSKRLEAENLAKQIPQNQFGATLGFLQGQPGADISQIQHPLAQGAALAGVRPLMAAQARAANRPAPRPIIRHVNVNGEIVREVSSPLTGEVTSRNTLGINPGRAKAASDALAAYNASDAILQNIREQLPRVLPAENLPQLIAQYGNIKINQFTQTNPEQKAFMDFLASAVVPLNRALGDNRISDIDRANLRQALPKETDTFATAIQKLDNFDTLFESTKDGALKAYTKPLSESAQRKEKRKPLSEGVKAKEKKPLSQSSNDPLGLGI